MKLRSLTFLTLMDLGAALAALVGQQTTADSSAAPSETEAAPAAANMRFPKASKEEWERAKTMGRGEHLRTYGLHGDVSRPNTTGAWYLKQTFSDALQTQKR